MSAVAWERTAPAVLLLVSVVVAVACGPLFGGPLSYRVSRDATVQYIGGELVTLAAAAVIAWAVLVGSTPRAWLLGAGAALYVLYTMVTVIFGQSYGRYGGTADRWFALFVLITTCALLCLAGTLSRLLREGSGHPTSAHRVTLVVLGAMFALLWISALASHFRSAAPSAEYQADPLLFWLVKYLDLAVVIPSAVLSALLWRGTWRTGGQLVLSFSTWMLAAIAGMQVAMVLLAGASAGSLGLAAVMGLGAGWCLWLTLHA